MPYLRNWRNLASRSCILQRETVLVITPQPQCVFAQERSPCLLLPQPNAPHGAKEGLGYLWLRGHCCLAGGFHSLKTIPNVFSFSQEADLACKGLVCTGPSHPP